MALHPQTRGGSGLGQAGAVASRQGIPQEGIMPSAPIDSEALSEIIQMLRGGQVGAERFMQFLSLLAESTLPGIDGERPQPQEPQQTGNGFDLAGLIGG